MAVTPQQARTQRAILDAAASVWARNPTASLGSVASAAGVGRATIHRHYPDRQTLHTALVEDSWAELLSAIVDAGPGHGSAMDVIERIVTAMIRTSDRVRILFEASENARSDIDLPKPGNYVDKALLAEIERGQRNGTLDPDVPARWIQLLIWSTVYIGLDAAADDVVPAHSVDDLISRTLRRAVGVQARD